MAKDKKKKIDIDQILLDNRQIFIFSVIGDECAENVIRDLVALDTLNHKPIVVWINSPGGSLSAGYAIIDAIHGILSPVITITCGVAGSMAGALMLVGEKRLMTENSIWMGHDMSGGIGNDYMGKVLARTKFMKKYRDKYFNLIKSYTKFTKRDIKKMQNDELWLMADECLEKGLVDKIISIIVYIRLELKKSLRNNEGGKYVYGKGIQSNVDSISNS